MIDSVWWYVLAGFLLGFILSTLWEWLYFRRRRMRIENRRIAELEATVRSLSVASYATESGVSPGFAAGYQSPLVFLEGEEDDIDTVEVIVPVTPELVNSDQSTTAQTVPAQPPYLETQFVASRPPSPGGTPVINGNGVIREMPTGEPDAGNFGRVETSQVEPSRPSVAPAALAAAAVAATAVLADDKDRSPAGSPPPEQPLTKTVVSEGAASETPALAAPQGQAPQEKPPGLVGDLSPTKQSGFTGGSPDDTHHAVLPAALVADSITDTASPVRPDQQTESAQPAQTAAPALVEPPAAVHDTQPPAPAWTTGQGQLAAPPAVTTSSTAESQPTATQAAPPGIVSSQPDNLETQEVRDLRRGMAAAIAAALGSKLVRDQKPPQQAAPPQPGSLVPEAVPNTRPPAAKVMPGIYDLPDDQLEVSDGLQDSPLSTASDLSSGRDSVPDLALDTNASRSQDAALPLSAILPPAPKPAPLSKNGQMRPPEATPTNVLAASGIKPEIEQVSNQLDNLIESINGLIEKTQPLLDQSAPRVARSENLSSPISLASTREELTGENLDSGYETSENLTGPYTAQNLSRMEYGLVQLMQAVRRLGRDVRSAL